MSTKKEPLFYYIQLKRELWILILCLYVGFADAQGQAFFSYVEATETPKASTMVLKGKVIDKSTKKPLAFTTVTSYHVMDSTLLMGGITDDEGVFSISIPKVAHFIKVEFIAYQPQIIEYNIEKSSSKEVDLGTIELEPMVNNIASINVFAEKSSIMMQLDKRVFNVGKDLISAGGTAEDVLRNVPGLSVDIDGKLTLRGSNAIRFLLDSRASSLLNHNSLSGLRQIRASQIERVEIITNPSARYEAEGVVGIVNIVLKENDQKGITGSLVANVGYPANHGIGTTLNFQKDKFNGFFEVGGWHLDKLGNGSFENRFYNQNDPDSTHFSNMERMHDRKHNSIYSKVGFDYFFDEKNSLLSSFSYMGMHGDNKTQMQYIDALGSIENVHLITDRVERELEHSHDWQGGIIYKTYFNRDRGHKLVTSLQYENDDKYESADYDELYFDKDKILIDSIDYRQKSGDRVNRCRITANIDYVLPIGEDTKLELGSQNSDRKIANNYKVDDIVNEEVITNSAYTNDFRYDERIYGGYGNLSCKHNKFSIQAGVRVEHTYAETVLALTDRHKKWTYTQLFPSLFFSYKPSSTNSFQISYNRRIRRPVLRDMNPFFTLRDRKNIFRGNPNIEPQLTDAYEIGHVKYWEKGVLSSIAYFKRTTNVIKRLQRLDENYPGMTITQAENLALKRNYGVEFIYTYSASKKWRLTGDVNIYHSYAGGSFEYQNKHYEVGGESFSMTAKVSSRQKIWKLNSQIMFSYSAPRTTTQGLNRSSFAVDLALGTDLFHDKATLVFNVLDVFNSRRRRSYSHDDTFYSEDNFLWQNRSFVLSIHYRINKQKERSIYNTPFEDKDKDSY